MMLKSEIFHSVSLKADLSHRWSASMYDAVKIISRCGVRICIVDYHTDSIAISRAEMGVASRNHLC